MQAAFKGKRDYRHIGKYGSMTKFSEYLFAKARSLAASKYITARQIYEE